MYLNGFARAEQGVITMKMGRYTPLYGTYLGYMDISDESLPFRERAEIAVQMGVVSGIYMAIGVELGTTGKLSINLMRATAAAAPAGIMTAVLAASTYAATKKGATVEHGPFGSVSVTPRLGVF